MKKIILSSKNAPEAIGPYSQGVRVGDIIFCSGMIPVDAVSGKIPATIEDQTNLVIQNIRGFLEDNSSSLQDVVKTTLFIKDMDSFSKINEIYGRYFTENQPARSTVEVSRLPKDVLIEIECIAVIK
ncbi:MAG: RidA family protein [Spirochaetes bacterium]|nr:RidA family protein [Spirochaetota bacterium]